MIIMNDITREKTETGYKYTLRDTNLDYTNSIEFSEKFFHAYYRDLDTLDNSARFILTLEYIKSNNFEAVRTIADLIPFYKKD